MFAVKIGSRIARRRKADRRCIVLLCPRQFERLRLTPCARAEFSRAMAAVNSSYPARGCHWFDQSHSHFSTAVLFCLFSVARSTREVGPDRLNPVGIYPAADVPHPRAAAGCLPLSRLRSDPAIWIGISITWTFATLFRPARQFSPTVF